MTRGRFITFEGGEGTGKSTQSRLLAKRLRGMAIDVVQTREPGGSLGAEIIRHVLLSGAAKPFGPEAEAVLFAAARADHIKTIIAPALKQGRWVICDRYIDSTRVYQGAAGNVDPRFINGLERLTVGDIVPDLTIILDIDVKTGLERAALRRSGQKVDRFEDERVEFHMKLREAYKEIAAANPERCALIDASGTPEAVAFAIWKAVGKRLDPATAPASIKNSAEPRPFMESAAR
jgi:dTMP kinase